jgi:regulatory protein
VKSSKPNRSEASDARKLALELLARREHSREELRRKLARRDLDAAEISSLLDQLRSERLQSDDRFTESYVHARRTRGFGPVRIRMELQERGVADAVISAHLDEHAVHWQDVLYVLYRKRYSDEPVGDYQERARKSRFLQYRGFDAEMIRRLLDDLNREP